MSGFFQSLLTNVGQGFFGNPYLRDYQHASKIFRPDAYALSPRLKFLFHVYFNINPVLNLNIPKNLGVLVKSVSLPNFTVDVQTMNQYNRKRLVQTKQKYGGVDITFHDDTQNQTVNLWNTYWNYYYADGRSTANNQQPSPTARGANNIYNQQADDLTGWGYVGEGVNSSQKPLFFTSIDIFGFHQKQFIKYTLINPLITKWSHDTYTYSEGGGTMQNTMSVEYETMNYQTGSMDGRKPGNTVPGFAEGSNYDRTPSPIDRPGSNASILGKGGLLDAAGGFTKALGDGNFLAAAVIAGTSYNTFKNKDLVSLAKREVVTSVGAATAQTLSAGLSAGARGLSWSTPAFGMSNKPGTAGSATITTEIGESKYVGPNPPPVSPPSGI